MGDDGVAFGREAVLEEGRAVERVLGGHVLLVHRLGRDDRRVRARLGGVEHLRDALAGAARIGVGRVEQVLEVRDALGLVAGADDADVDLSMGRRVPLQALDEVVTGVV